MTITLATKPGINGANTLSIPKDWDATWFRKFIANSLKGADVRNAVGVNGISVTGTIASPYATIGFAAPITLPGPVTISASASGFGPTLLVNGPTAGGSGLEVTGATGHGARIDLVDGGAGNQDYLLTSGFVATGIFAIYDGTRGAVVIQANTTGNVTIPSPTTGFTLGLSAASTTQPALQINGKASGISVIEFDVNAVTQGFIGSAGAAGQIIIGSSAGDLCIHTEGGNIKFGVASSGAHAWSINGATTTGTQNATFTATNKPGTGANSPIAWLPCLTAGGTQGYIPIFGA
jgi:hypothetical protein